jgi:hypothetical protein
MVDEQGWVNMLPQMRQSTDQESLENHRATRSAADAQVFLQENPA